MRRQGKHQVLYRYLISIHAPAKGATYQPSGNVVASTNFNPRIRKGCDKLSCERHRRGCNFNPRTHEGGDYCKTSSTSVFSKFQSTHPRRGRHHHQVIYWMSFPISIHAPTNEATYAFGTGITSEESFQSTHPRRVRQQNSSFLRNVITISIHAPAKGATHGFLESYHTFLISIHAPAKGATFE